MPLGRFSMNYFLPDAKITRDQGKIFKVGDLAQFNIGEEKPRPINYSAPAKTMEKGVSAMSRGEATSPQQKLASEQRQNKDMVHEKVKDAAGHKVGRNDPCPCGSGKKFKKCCGE